MLVFEIVWMVVCCGVAFYHSRVAKDYADTANAIRGVIDNQCEHIRKYAEQYGAPIERVYPAGSDAPYRSSAHMAPPSSVTVRLVVKSILPGYDGHKNLALDASPKGYSPGILVSVSNDFICDAGEEIECTLVRTGRQGKK